MIIRNRIVDIKVLQTHILQDYFKMELVFNFTDDEWKTKLETTVKNGVNSDYPSRYVGTWEKIQIKGITDYSVDDMDTTIIIAILKGRGYFDCCTTKFINKTLDCLQDDRNIDAHTNGNETDSELLQWAFGSLHNLNKFISEVSKSSQVSDNEKRSFTKKYNDKIENLRRYFEEDYKETLLKLEMVKSIKREIISISASEDSHGIFTDIVGIYLNKKDSNGEIDYDLLYQFLHAADDAGIVWACSWLGDIYFEGLMTQIDYKKAGNYYEKGFNELTPPQRLKLASIYNNKLGTSHHSKEDVKVILKSCESTSWQIKAYTTQEGYEFYGLVRVKSNL